MYSPHLSEVAPVEEFSFCIFVYVLEMEAFPLVEFSQFNVTQILS